MTSQSATSASPHINEEADKSNNPPACSKYQEYSDTVVEKTVNEFAEEASCEINKEELSSLEQEKTMDQFGDEARFEINREELSSVEQEETIDQMGIEASCESHADMSDPALYIHSMEKIDLATRKRLISQGAFQPKAHEMKEKRFPTSRCGSHDRSFSESWYYTKVGKNNIRRKWLSYSPKEDAVFCHFCLFFVAVIKNKRSQRSVIGIGKRLLRSLQSTKNLIVILTQQLIFIIFASTFPSMNNFLTKPQRRRQ